eukprot:scaffold27684_cov52-Phaeocystis_antarctica.AAC.3
MATQHGCGTVWLPMSTPARTKAAGDRDALGVVPAHLEPGELHLHQQVVLPQLVRRQRVVREQVCTLVTAPQHGGTCGGGQDAPNPHAHPHPSQPHPHPHPHPHAHPHPRSGPDPSPSPNPNAHLDPLGRVEEHEEQRVVGERGGKGRASQREHRRLLHVCGGCAEAEQSG